eukprot:SAG31_NODE_1798_length_7243_cov_4.509518_1_plen_247_part_00
MEPKEAPDNQTTGRVRLVDFEKWLKMEDNQKSAIADVIYHRGLAACLPANGLSTQLRKGRIRHALSAVTAYSKTGVCGTVCRVLKTMPRRAELTDEENQLVFLQEQLEKLAESGPTETTWRDFSNKFKAMLGLRSEMVSERGQAVLDCICMDEEVLTGIGAAHQMQDMIGKVPDEVVTLLKQGPGRHLQEHAYEYRRKFDAELAAIRRLKELHLQAVAFIATVLLSGLVGLANFASRVVYDDVYAD